MSVPGSALDTEILVAGIGNVFLGDDGFGVEVARRLAARPLPEGVTVRDFGIRGFDLAFALRDYDTVIFVDAVPGREGPGTLHLIDASDAGDGPPGVDPHGMDPAKVLAFARTLGTLPRKVYVLGCEPAVVPDEAGDEIVGELSPPVRAVLDRAADRVEDLVDTLRAEAHTTHSEEIQS